MKFERTTCLKQKKYLSFSKGIRISRKYPDPKYPLFLFQSCCRKDQKRVQIYPFFLFSFLPCNWVFFLSFLHGFNSCQKKGLSSLFLRFETVIFECCISIFVPDWIWVLVDMSKWFFYWSFDLRIWVDLSFFKVFFLGHLPLILMFIICFLWIGDLGSSCCVRAWYQKLRIFNLQELHWLIRCGVG